MSFSNAFCQKKTLAFWLEFHSNLFLWAQLASGQHLFILWLGSEQWRAIYWSNDHLFQWPFRWRHNGRYGVSNHQPHDCILNRFFRRRSKKASKLCVTGLCAENSPGTGEFPAQIVSNAENISISWRHHDVNMQNTGVAKNHTSGPNCEVLLFGLIRIIIHRKPRDIQCMNRIFILFWWIMYSQSQKIYPSSHKRA